MMNPLARAWVLGLAALLASAAPPPAGTVAVTSVRFWSLGNVTRVAVEVGGVVKVHSEKLSAPDRLAVDLSEARMQLGDKGVHVVPIGDKLVKQVRVAQKEPRLTRVVLDLERAVDYEISQVTGPNRVMIEVRAIGTEAGQSLVTQSRSGAEKLTEKNLQPAEAETVKPAPPKAPETQIAESRSEPAPKTAAAKPNGKKGTHRAEPDPPAEKLPDSMFERKSGARAPVETAAARRPAEEPVRAAEEPKKPTEVVIPPSSNEPDASPKPARPTSAGTRTLSRALGLKINRVVLDPGHGAHDHGTTGPTGLAEKDLVLDVTLRLGALLEASGVEVVYTRKTDVFIPLEERTAIANQNKADLFLSIHANAVAAYRGISGSEVYYLNLASSKDAMDVAARENASYKKSLFELKDLVQKIMLREKLEESRDLAGKLQSSLSSTWTKTNPTARNRGVKRALFVVLIGATMPSVLAEIGFLSNPKDEATLKKPETRQKLADALFRGIQNYSGGLSQAPGPAVTRSAPLQASAQ